MLNDRRTTFEPKSPQRLLGAGLEGQDERGWHRSIGKRVDPLVAVVVLVGHLINPDLESAVDRARRCRFFINGRRVMEHKAFHHAAKWIRVVPRKPTRLGSGQELVTSGDECGGVPSQRFFESVVDGESVSIPT